MPLQVTVFAGDPRNPPPKGFGPGRLFNVMETWTIDDLRRQLYLIAYQSQPGPAIQVRLYTENGIELDSLQFVPMAPNGRIFVVRASLLHSYP